MTKGKTVIAVVGGGPRGASVLERLSARLDPNAQVEIHLYEPGEAGAGRVWSTTQSDALVMNTYAGQVTLFTDESVQCGHIASGPSFFEWATTLDPGRAAETGDGGPHAQAGARGDLQLWSHPTRAQFGRYLAWFVQRAADRLPAGATFTHHRARVTGVELGSSGTRGGGVRAESAGARADDARAHAESTSTRAESTSARAESGTTYLVRADDGELVADAVVLALGWLPGNDSETAVTDTAWVAPENPIEQNLDRFAAGSDIAVRGLGMGFYDALVLLTEGRGGRFEPIGPVDPDSPHAVDRLRYIPSGREPRLHIGSVSGVPFRSKSVYSALPPVARTPAFDAAIASAQPGRIDFAADLWPAIRHDAVAAYDETRSRFPDGRDAPQLDLSVLEKPLPDDLRSSAEYSRWLVEFLDHDLREAARGERSPLKAAAWVISATRARVAGLASFDGFASDESYAAYQRYMSLGAKLGSGPPAFRAAQLLACIEAGIVVPFGSGLRVAGGPTGGSGEGPAGERDAGLPGGLTGPIVGEHSNVPAESGTVLTDEAEIWSPVIDDRVRVVGVLDAWMHLPDVSSTPDPLVRGLITSGLARPHDRHLENGNATRTGAFDIEPTASRLIGWDGNRDRALYSIGIPQEQLRGYSIISPIPRTNSPLLRETDAVAADLVARFAL